MGPSQKAPCLDACMGSTEKPGSGDREPLLPIPHVRGSLQGAPQLLTLPTPATCRRCRLSSQSCRGNLWRWKPGPGDIFPVKIILRSLPLLQAKFRPTWGLWKDGRWGNSTEAPPSMAPHSYPGPAADAQGQLGKRAPLMSSGQAPWRGEDRPSWTNLRVSGLVQLHWQRN